MIKYAVKKTKIVQPQGLQVDVKFMHGDADFYETREFYPENYDELFDLFTVFKHFKDDRNPDASSLSVSEDILEVFYDNWPMDRTNYQERTEPVEFTVAETNADGSQFNVTLEKD